MERLKRSFLRAISGLFHAFKYERNFRIHIAATVIVLAFLLIFQADYISAALALIAIFAVLVAEIFNTAIERLVDLIVGEQKKPLAKAAKDLGAAAVLLSAFQAFVLALIIAYRSFFL